MERKKFEIHCTAKLFAENKNRRVIISKTDYFFFKTAISNED